MRVSTAQMHHALQQAMERNYERYHLAQQAVITGKRIRRPSDDPFGASLGITLHRLLQETEQYQRNLTTAKNFLFITEVALEELNDLLRQTKSLAIQAATDTQNTEGRLAIAYQIRQMLEQVVNIGNNTTYGDRFIFGGLKTLTPPFSVDNDTLIYHGDYGNLNVELSPAVVMSINVQGDPLVTGIYRAMAQVVRYIETNNIEQLSREGLQELQNQMDNLLRTRAIVGSKIQQVEMIQQRLEKRDIDFTELLSTIEDADAAEAITQLRMMEVTYQFTLATAARMQQLSLLDFLA
ncbi:MAG: flagellar hook-associated protein FlgL [Armatimonadota bacterium]|nr:flagellar hook-associated protein FlgL [Armatimonadota bacterium]MDW8105493.1 flagellar hook-associated protein FlgL [Armatimonadota bacterium]MDW8291044.1 flagellar hook-associated protein FlgL [Armatimonadota bacterium]